VILRESPEREAVILINMSNWSSVKKSYSHVGKTTSLVKFNGLDSVEVFTKLIRECQGLITPPVNVMERPKLVTSIRHAVLLRRSVRSAELLDDVFSDGVDVNTFEPNVKNVDTRFNKK